MMQQVDVPAGRAAELGRAYVALPGQILDGERLPVTRRWSCPMAKRAERRFWEVKTVPTGELMPSHSRSALPYLEELFLSGGTVPRARREGLVTSQAASIIRKISSTAASGSAASRASA